MALSVAYEDETGVVGNLAPLVKIEGDGIGALDAVEERGELGRQLREGAERAVDVEPELLAARELGEPRQVVDRADVDGAGGRGQEEGLAPGAAIGKDGRFERGDLDAESIVDGNDAKRGAPEPGDLHRLGHADVRGRGGVGDEVRSTDPVGPHRDAELGRARDEERDEVRHGRAGHEHAARRQGKLEELAHPCDDLPFDRDRNLIAPRDVCVQSRGEHLREHADHGPRAMHPGHEAGMRVARGIRQDFVEESSVEGGEVAGLLGERLAKAGADRVRDRLPDRPIADPFDVVEHIVEHAMALMAHRRPIRRIERRIAGCGHLGSMSLRADGAPRFRSVAALPHGMRWSAGPGSSIQECCTGRTPAASAATADPSPGSKGPPHRLPAPRRGDRGFFFGEGFAATVWRNRWSRIPECTGIWSKTV